MISNAQASGITSIINLSNNIIVDAPWAIEVGAENCVESSNITIENNQSTQSRFGDLAMKEGSVRFATVY
jgi:hypothetical protein